jgi:hypothetical protein
MHFTKNFMVCKVFEVLFFYWYFMSSVPRGRGGSGMPTSCSIVVQEWQSGWKNEYCIHKKLIFCAEQILSNSTK